PIALAEPGDMPAPIERISRIVGAAAAGVSQQETGVSIAAQPIAEVIVDRLRPGGIRVDFQNVAGIVGQIPVAPDIDAGLEAVASPDLGKVGFQAVVVGDIETSVPAQVV